MFFPRDGADLIRTGEKYCIVTSLSWNTSDYHSEVDSNGKDLGLSAHLDLDGQALLHKLPSRLVDLYDA